MRRIPVALAQAARHGKPLEGCVVVVVDDYPETVDVLCTALELAGARAVGVSSSSASLSLIVAAPPDALVTDLSMPEMDGCELIRQLGDIAQASAVPTVVLTAFASDENIQRCRRAGARAVLSKPLDPAQLIRTLSGLIERRSSPA